ncbi:RNA polymerase I-specific transcription initiation factor RRN3 isoform X1 [Pistacia vera]|uniref:RNA polymerase I-specific transcription initiation factor RRN3 isoform X1 n=1 Tax=Pistacia vera TaxID=55513 RepID=UPI0012635CE2|nr:RNA polymerase I-specific transcription initiation factor RRN3 isoform X1 [Pistacia vera]
MHQPNHRALLETSLKALSRAVSSLDIVHHESLLTSIFQINIWNFEPGEMDAMIALIISLASSDGKYVDSCLTMLVNNFTPPSSTLLLQPWGIEIKKQVISRVHEAFENITKVVPLAPLRLLPIVLQRMPTVRNKDDRVEIGWDDDLHDESGKDIFEMDLEGVEQDGDELPEGSLSKKSSREKLIAELLDSLMELTFEHLESCKGDGRWIKVFDILLQSFQITVLNAYKSKFAQFVMFYACALDPENCGVRFSTMLADIFASGVHSQITRMSAVSYLASFLSRAKFLSASIVISLLKRLVDWCLEYCNIHGGDINPKAHRVFYSGCQAIIYVLCFRMRSIMDVPRLKSQLLLMPLETILKHELNPLKVCLPSVVSEFLKQSKAAHLFTVSKTFVFNDLLESELSRAFGGLERLDMFFPFDPCLLKKCDSYIRPNFVYWTMVRTTYHDDEVDSSEEDVDEDFVDANGDDGMGRSEDEEDPGDDEFDYSALNKMSITPKNCVGLMVK